MYKTNFQGFQVVSSSYTKGTNALGKGMNASVLPPAMDKL